MHIIGTKSRSSLRTVFRSSVGSNWDTDDPFSRRSSADSLSSPGAVSFSRGILMAVMIMMDQSRD